VKPKLDKIKLAYILSNEGSPILRNRRITTQKWKWKILYLNLKIKF